MDIANFPESKMEIEAVDDLDGMATVLRDSANLRDLGGIPAAGGMRVRRGLVYRSAMLHSEEEAVARGLRGLAPVTIVDFRSDGERRMFPTPWEDAGCSDYWFREHVSSTGNLQLLLSQALHDPAATARDVMIELYRDMPTGQLEAYRALFTKLAAGRTPLIFHCAAGKDRTGVAAALLLEALAVPRERIMEDYLATALFDLRSRVIDRQIATSSRREALLNAPSEILVPLLAVDTAYLDAMFESLDARYGSIERYLHDALGIGEQSLAQLRDHLLEPDTAPLAADT